MEDIPKHHDLDIGFKGEMGEEGGVISGLGAQFDVKELLALGKHIGDLADAAFELAHCVVCTHTHHVLLAHPFHAQCHLLLRATAAIAATCRHFGLALSF